MDITEPLVTSSEVKLNARHLSNVPTDELEAVIADVHVVFIQDGLAKFGGNVATVSKLKVIEKFLVQHVATLNIRRADSESVAGMSKSVSVVKDKDLDQTEYGQMAKKIAKDIPLTWAIDEKPACVRIF